MRKLLLNTYMWVAVGFAVVAFADLANGGSIWIVWFALGMVFAIIAYRRPPSNPTTESQTNPTDGTDKRETP